MPTSLIDADSLLAIDVGAVTTRAFLYDVVDGRYRFIARGIAPTTAGSPYHDVGEGVHYALDQLQSVSGRVLADSSDGRLIFPSRSDGSGIDTCVVTLSAGKPLKVVAVGLLEDISAESAQQLASTIYAEVVDRLSLNDRRRSSAKLDTLLRARPDLVIVAGGIEGGAVQSVLHLLEPVGLACYLLPEAQRPEVLYAGNSALAEEVKNAIGSLTHLLMAPNLRPTLDIEQLSPAQTQLTEVYRSVASRNLPGVAELDGWTGGKLMPTATAFGRVIRFLSRVGNSSNGVMGVDVGASATTLAASFSGDLILGVYPELGLGKGVTGLLDQSPLEKITRWLTCDVSATDVRDYIYNKTIYPSLVPASKESLEIEQALARQAMQVAVKRLSSHFIKHTNGSGLLPRFEPIVAAGSIFTHAPSFGQALLTVLDGLQPTAVTTVILDQNDLLPSLGAAASINSILPIHILESNAILNLATVITAVGNTRLGAPVLRVKITEEGRESSLEVKYGSIEVIPLPVGRSARLQLQPLNRFDVGMGGPGRSGGVRVNGSAIGVVIDARGRPLRLPGEVELRKELLNKWSAALG